MSTFTQMQHTSATCIQKIWKQHRFCKMLKTTTPHINLHQEELKEVKNKPPIKIYGPQSGDPPSDSEWCCEFDDDFYEDDSAFWGEDSTTFNPAESEGEYEYDDGDAAEEQNERQFECR